VSSNPVHELGLLSKEKGRERVGERSEMRQAATKTRDKGQQNEDKGGRKETREGRRLYILSIHPFYCIIRKIAVI
jgi:hypothetical protein